MIKDATFSEWLYKALSLLVVSCPCALVVSIPLGVFSGIGAASKKGILVKGGNYLEALKESEIVVFDKTGTLTKGKLSVIGICLPDDTHFNTLDDMKDDLKNIFIDALIYNNDAYFEDNQVTGGNSTDKAILTFVGKIPLTKKIEDKIQFNSENKYSYVKLNEKDKKYFEAIQSTFLPLKKL